MNATGEALNSTIKPMVERITAVINSFTKWIEANKGLVASIAVTAGSIATLGAALLAIGTVSRVLSAGVGALSGVFGAFAGVASALAGKGVVVQGAFSLMARVFADYRNAAIPAMVGTSREINANSDKIADAMDKIADARRRLVAIEEGDEEALTGVLRPIPALTGREFRLMGVDW